MDNGYSIVILCVENTVDFADLIGIQLRVLNLVMIKNYQKPTYNYNKCHNVDS